MGDMVLYEYLCALRISRSLYLCCFASFTIVKMWNSTNAAPWSNYSHDVCDSWTTQAWQDWKWQSHSTYFPFLNCVIFEESGVCNLIYNKGPSSLFTVRFWQWKRLSVDIRRKIDPLKTDHSDFLWHIASNNILPNHIVFVTCLVNNRCRLTVKCLLTGPSQQCREKILKKINNTRNKCTMSNDGL